MSRAIRTRVRAIDRRLRAHAGGIELLDLSRDGVATVRYTGMCTGCPLRPMTTAATVRPALLDLDEVRVVEVAGGRLSAEAEQRIGMAFDWGACPGIEG